MNLTILLYHCHDYNAAPSISEIYAVSGQAWFTKNKTEVEI